MGMDTAIYEETAEHLQHEREGKENNNDLNTIVMHGGDSQSPSPDKYLGGAHRSKVHDNSKGGGGYPEG